MEEVSHPRARVFMAIEELCTGCGICQMVCSLSKTGRVNPHLARIGVAHSERDLSYSPVICRHCKNPPCKLACPVPGAMTWGANGVVVINDESCIGCLACVEACPFAAIQVGPDREMLKCDLCDGDPRCVRYCPPRVIYSPSQPLPWPQQSCLQYVNPHRVAVIRQSTGKFRKK
jgi:Fe-S-cluster-containing dehydrogenase component